MNETDLFCELPSGIRLCYRTDGRPDGRPMLLLAGLALDLTSWQGSLVSALVDAGFFVIRLDNRDSGRSTHVPTPPPNTLRQALGITTSRDYDLGDLADDAIGLLDHLDIDEVDLVGMSMGGMIAQIIAATSPDRVRSLTSIISTTGARRVGQPAKSTLLSMAKPAARTPAASARRHLAALDRLGSPVFGWDPTIESQWALDVWERGGGPAAGAGTARQVAAIQKSGDRTKQVRSIIAPTLVIHGDRDPMVHPSGGRATADAIPGARLVTVADMRHHIPASLVPRIAGLIVEHAKSAQSQTRNQPR